MREFWKLGMESGDITHSQIDVPVTNNYLSDYPPWDGRLNHENCYIWRDTLNYPKVKFYYIFLSYISIIF